jgi:hypothetical protein
MDLQQVIKVLEKHNKWRRDKDVPTKTRQVNPIILGKAIDIAVEELYQQSEERANVWISVDDELPDHLKVCLVWCNDSYYISVLNRAGGLNEWIGYGDYFESDKVSHWIYAIAPPKKQ